MTYREHYKLGYRWWTVAAGKLAYCWFVKLGPLTICVYDRKGYELHWMDEPITDIVIP
jgi:hypothetical protein